MTTREPTTPPILLTAAERAVLRQGLAEYPLPDHPLLAAALQQGDQLLPFLVQLADLLRAGQRDAVLTQLEAALAPVAALDRNAEGLTTALRDLTSAWLTLAHLCPDGTLPVTVLTDPGALLALAEAAEAISEQAQELALRASDRARLLDQRMQA